MNNRHIQQMFSSIAPRYDLLNRLLSCGIDIYWRRRAVEKLQISESTIFLDIAAGTCDVAIEVVGKGIPNVKAAGVDFSLPMLIFGKKKIKGKDIFLHCADAHRLPFKDKSFDGAIVAFGLRNFTDRKTGISEMMRVVKNGGKVVILEFTMPDNLVFKNIYCLYFKKILPVIGGIISGKREAYEYLPESVMEFPTKDTLKQLMDGAGLIDVKYSVLTFGIAAIHVGLKP